MPRFKVSRKSCLSVKYTLVFDQIHIYNMYIQVCHLACGFLLPSVEFIFQVLEFSLVSACL